MSLAGGTRGRLLVQELAAQPPERREQHRGDGPGNEAENPVGQRGGEMVTSYFLEVLARPGPACFDPYRFFSFYIVGRTASCFLVLFRFEGTGVRSSPWP